MQIEHIDALASQKQRDVLYVVFHPPAIGKKLADAISVQTYMQWDRLFKQAEIRPFENTPGIATLHLVVLDAALCAVLAQALLR